MHEKGQGALYSDGIVGPEHGSDTQHTAKKNLRLLFRGGEMGEDEKVAQPIVVSGWPLRLNISYIQYGNIHCLKVPVAL